MDLGQAAFMGYRREDGTVGARNYLGVVYGRLGRHDEAIAVARRIIESFPDDAITQLNLRAQIASIEWSRGRLDAAREAQQARRAMASSLGRSLDEFYAEMALAAEARRREGRGEKSTGEPGARWSMSLQSGVGRARPGLRRVAGADSFERAGWPPAPWSPS